MEMIHQAAFNPLLEICIISLRN